jgi:DNA-binding IclR family transcriptional regulator
MSGVGVLDKAVVILAACVDRASLAQLVERTKLPRATAHRLAQALEIHRLLVRDAHGRWRPGPRLGELANAAPDVLLSSAEPMLAALRELFDSHQQAGRVTIEYDTKIYYGHLA